MWTIPQEAAAKDNVGLVFDNGLHQPVVFGRIVLEVGVLDDHDLPLGRGEPGAECRPFPAVDFVAMQVELVAIVSQLSGQRLHDLPGAVPAAVVDHDELLVDGDRDHPAEDGAEVVFLVEDGNHHGQHEIIGQGVETQLPTGGITDEFAGTRHPFRRVSQQPGGIVGVGVHGGEMGWFGADPTGRTGGDGLSEKG